MANIIYANSPRGVGARTGAAASQGLEQGFGLALAESVKRDRARRAAEMMKQVTDSPDRKTALERAAVVSTQMAEDVADIQALYRVVDQHFPVKDETPHPIEAVGPDNKRVKKFVKGGDLTSLNETQGVEKMFGPGFQLARPEQEYDFFFPDATGAGPTAAGRGPLSARPQGARTKEELDFSRQGRLDREAEERGRRQEVNLGLAEQREARLQRTMADILGRQRGADANKIQDNLRADLRSGEAYLVRGLGKILPDGTFGFDDDNKQKLFNDRVAMFGEAVEKAYSKNPNKAHNYVSLAQEAIKAFPTAAEKPKPEASPGKGKVQEEKKINGIVYQKIGGKWYTK